MLSGEFSLEQKIFVNCITINLFKVVRGEDVRTPSSSVQSSDPQVHQEVLYEEISQLEAR